MPPVAGAAPSLDDLSLPRRVAVAQLAGDIVATERAMADLYADFAADAGPAGLRAGLEELARAKHDQVAMAGQVLSAGADPAAPPRSHRRARAALPDAYSRRAEMFLEAFEGERALEVAYRELAVLLAETGLLPGLGDLAARAARHRARLRELYVRYS